MKKITNLFIILYTLFAGDILATEKTICVGAPKAPPVLPILRMIDTDALGKGYNIDIKIWNSPEILIAMVQGKEASFFAFPLTVASKIYNKGLNIQLTNVNTWGVASLISKNPSVKDWKDLKGKTLHIFFKSSPPDIFAHYFLSKAGLEEKRDYQVVYSSKAEHFSLVASGKVENAITIQPDTTFILEKNPKFRVVKDFEKEWQRIRGKNNSIPTAGIGILGEIGEKNPMLVKKFEKEYKKALEWVLKNPKEIGKLAEKKLGMNAKMVEKSVSKMGLHYMIAVEAKKILNEYYQILREYDPKSIGGNVPDENFYFYK